MRVVVLFDIDGTLLSARGGARSAVQRALDRIFGERPPSRPWPIGRHPFAGKTDPQIFRELLAREEVPADLVEKRLPAALQEYSRALHELLLPGDVHPLPGAHALVCDLAARTDIQLGILTGNLESCARLKLAHAELADHFPFGAYGSDCADRMQLPAIARARAAQHLGTAVDAAACVLVGDSVHDIRCARGDGMRAVAVATGPDSAAALRAERPEAQLADLADLLSARRAILDGS